MSDQGAREQELARLSREARELRGRLSVVECILAFASVLVMFLCLRVFVWPL